MTGQASIKKDFLSTLDATLREFHMIGQKDSILAAVSGGPDSMALLLSLLSLKEKHSLTIGIAHLNHMLRKEESLRDEAFVREFARTRGLTFHVEQTDVSAHAKKHRLSIEEAGRNVRYAFFNRLADQHGYNRIALGHTRDDNVELVLMNLLRGAGPTGLSGIPPVRDNRYIRPLIRMPKRLIIDFLTLEKQTFMVDSSNTDTAYLRNRIRNNLIPHLQTEYNPEIAGALDRLSHILRQEEAFLEMETEKHFNRCLMDTDQPGSIMFSKPLLSELHPALLNRVLRKAIKAVKKNLNRICLAHINAIVDFCFHPSPGTSLDLPGQIRVYKKEAIIIIKKEDESLRNIGKREKESRQREMEKQGKKS